MVKIGCYVPSTHLEQVKQAMFSAGGGRIGNYEQCSWQVLGQGQFKPRVNSKPFIGLEGRLESVDEYRLELVCDKTTARAVVEAMKVAHPYETPAYDVVEMLSL